jgi:hypothetical protein
MIFFQQFFLSEKILENYRVSNVNSTDFINILHPGKKKKTR